MKKLLKLSLLSLVLGLFCAPSNAERAMSGSISFNDKTGINISHSKIEGQIGSFDKVSVEIDGQHKEIFDSEGREVKEVFPVDVDLDGKKEYLITMDCGGSGGYYDLTLLKEKEDCWKPIWEDTLSQPKIRINENNGEVSIKIKHFVMENDSMKNMISVLNYRNGSIIKRDFNAK